MNTYRLRRHWTRRGFNRPIYGSITNEINYQDVALPPRHRPTLVRLGYAASTKYAWEHWAERISDAPKKVPYWLQGKVPIRHKDLKASGVMVE